MLLFLQEQYFFTIFIQLVGREVSLFPQNTNFAPLHLILWEQRLSRFAPDGRKSVKILQVNKDKEIKLRLSEEDKKEIEKRAKKTGLSMSEYLRRTALNRKINVRFSDEEIEAWKNLTSISNSLKNLSNILNKEHREHLIFEIRNINEQIKKELKKFN